MGVLLSGHVPHAPFDMGVGVGLDEGVDGADLAGLVVTLVVVGASQRLILVLGGWDGIIDQVGTSIWCRSEDYGSTLGGTLLLGGTADPVVWLCKKKACNQNRFLYNGYYTYSNEKNKIKHFNFEGIFFYLRHRG